MHTQRLALLLLLPGCLVLEVHRGNGVSATEERAVGAFDGVSNEIGLDVRVTLGEVPSVRVTCDENLLADLITEVEDGVLVVHTRQDGWSSANLLPQVDCVVDVAASALTSLSTSGSGDLTVAGEVPQALSDISSSGSGDILVSAPIEVDRLDAGSSGSGLITLGAVDAHQVHLSSSGSGDVAVGEGAAVGLDLDSSGSGDLLARGLLAEEVQVWLSGSGDAEATATVAVRGGLSGSGDLTVWGAPAERDVQTSGSGDVRYAE